jgi:DNA mismatch repair protein MutS
VRGHLAVAEKADDRLQKERWFLDAAELYGDAVEDLRRSLEQAGLASRGLQGFRRYLAQYLGGDAFQSLRKETKALLTDLTAIQYCVLIDGGTVTVQPYNAEADYSTVIEEAFARFRQGAVKDYRVKFPPPSGMNHVEAMILERVALLHPQVFEVLATFCATHRGFLDSTVVAFDREIQFYAAWLEYTAAFRRAGLAFCYPQISAHDKNISSRGSFDLALAGRLIRDNAPVVLNDFHVHGRERILVVTGPNQGGKTTFARTFGQLHYLASLGCPVPGTEARLFLCDRLRVLFERREDVTTLRGKLEDDLIRLHRLLAEATPNSLLIFNEVFSSTTVADAVLLSQNVMERLTRLDAVGVWVTFLDELSSLNEKAVSLVAGVVPEDPTRRTFKIERRPANGLAYALAIAEKHRLTYAQLKERLRP